MGLLEWLKGTRTPPEPPSSPLLRPGENGIIPVLDPRCREVQKISIRPSDPLPLEALFTSGRVDETLPGFPFRTKQRVTLLSSTEHGFSLSAANALIAFDRNGGKMFSLDESPFGAANVVEGNCHGALFRSENTIGYLDYQSGTLHLYQFAWHPFRTAMNESRWFVGTRETVDGPGELYCFSLGGEYLWGLQWSEQFVNYDHVIKATPSSLLTTEQSADVIVATMDRLSRLSPDGALLTRVALSDLREADLREKESRREGDRSRDPKTREEFLQTLVADIKEGFTSAMETAGLNSPCAGYTYDPQTETMFVLEDEGRLTAWDRAGTLLWTHRFNENGGFITLVDDLVVVSLWSGALFWVGKDGEVSSSAEMPAPAVSVTPIPDTGRYLVVCENGRRYELDRHTGEATEGPEGDRNMRVFKYQGRVLVYDGYLWATPNGQGWQRYAPRLAEDATRVSDLSPESSPPPIRANKPFKEVWRLVNPDKRPFEHFAVDTTNRRVYVGRSKSVPTDQEKTHQEDQFACCHEVCGYDFSLHLIWSQSYLSELTSLTVSPEGDAVFVGMWGEGLAHDPAVLVVLDPEGRESARFPTPATPLSIEFEGADLGVLTDFHGTRTRLTRVGPGEWVLQGEAEAGKGRHEVTTAQETVRELKTEMNVGEVVPDGEGFLLLGKDEVAYVSEGGTVRWRAGCPPNSLLNRAQWLQSQEAYLWYAGDSYRLQVTVITPQGKVLRSQRFEGVAGYHDREIDVADDSFVMMIGRAMLCCFEM